MSAEQECVCGGLIREVELPPEIAKMVDGRCIWVHVSTFDTRCYPDVPVETATAEPYDIGAPRSGV